MDGIINSACAAIGAIPVDFPSLLSPDKQQITSK